MPHTGWLLDVYVDGKDAVLWIKLEDGRSLRLVDRYKPDLYAEPADGCSIEDLAESLRSHPNVDLVDVEEKYCSLDADERKQVLHVFVDEAANYRAVLDDLEGTRLLKALYNVDLPHVQRYLLRRGVAPTSKVEVEHDGSRLVGVRVLDDSSEIKPPPFSVCAFALEPDSRKGDEPVKGINLLDVDSNVFNRLQGDEAEILKRFQEAVLESDPDFLVSPRVEASLRRLKVRSELRGIALQIGRVETGRSRPLKSSLDHRGRVAVDLDSFEDYGVAGITERSRFTFAPPGLSAKWPAGRTIDSRQCFEAMKRGILIPRRGFYVEPKTARETLLRDRGGFIMAPEAGLHENVGELDYESMFPNIMIRDNVSYETLKGVSEGKTGLLGIVAREPLERRLRFKHLRRRFPKDSLEWIWCEQRQQSLKGILVCIYGYSGCFANRYGNVTTFEEVNRLSRDRILDTVNIAQEQGFRVIYADTDSVFVKKAGATVGDYEGLAGEISSRVGLPITLDHHYKFLVLLRRETDSRLEVAKRYFGKLMDGGFNYRGIELRRHDTPPFVKGFQEELMRILFDADDAEKVRRVQLPKALEYVRRACEEVLEGRVSADGLRVSKRLGRAVDDYRGRPPHVVAAKQLALKGEDMRSGDVVDFLFVNSRHKNPYRRVVPSRLIDEEWRGYDRKKYADLVQDAAEKILGVFGFKRMEATKPRHASLTEVIRRKD